MQLSLKLLKDCGLLYDGTLCYFECDKRLFLANFEERILKHEKTLQTFMKDFEECLDDFNCFASFYSSSKCKFSDSIISLPSSFNIMLSIPSFQTRLTHILMEKMIKFHMNVGMDPVTTLSIPHIVISQYRWLNDLNEAENILSAITESIKLLDDQVISDVIILFPDIFDSRHHDRVAQELKELISSNPSICPVIYHTIGCLTISEALLREIHSEALSILSKIPLKEVYYIIKFLGNNVPGTIDDRDKTVMQIRTRILKDHDSFKKNLSKLDDIESNDSLDWIKKCWDEIQCAIKFVKCFPLILYHILIDLEWSEITNIDVIFILLIHDSFGFDNRVIKLLGEIKNFHPELLWPVFGKEFQDLINTCAESIFDILIKLIKLKPEIYCYLSHNIITTTFIYFNNGYKKQLINLLFQFITHKSSQISLRCIKIVDTISRQDIKHLSSHIPDFMKLLKNARIISLSNPKLVFEIILNLSLISPDASSVNAALKIRDEIVSFILSPDSRLKKIGVIGYASLLQSVLKNYNNQLLLLQDLDYSSIPKYLDVFYQNLEWSVLPELFDSFFTIIKKVKLNEELNNLCAKYFSDLIDNNFVTKAPENCHMFSLSDREVDDAINIFNYVHSRIVNETYYTFISGPYSLRALLILFSNSKNHSIEVKILKFLSLPICLEPNNNVDGSLKLPIYCLALIWIFQIINASYTINPSDPNIYSIFDRALVLLNDFLSLNNALKNCSIWDFSTSKAKKPKCLTLKPSKSKGRKRKSEEKLCIENEDCEKDLKDREGDNDDILEVKFNSISEILILDWIVIKFLLKRMNDDPDFLSNTLHLFTLLSYVFAKLKHFDENIYDHSDPNSHLFQSFTLFTDLLSIYTTLSAITDADIVFDDENLSPSITSAKYLILNCILILFEKLKSYFSNKSCDLLHEKINSFFDDNQIPLQFINICQDSLKSSQCLFSCLILMEILKILQFLFENECACVNFEELFLTVYNKEWVVSLCHSKKLETVFIKTFVEFSELLSLSQLNDFVSILVTENMSSILSSTESDLASSNHLLNRDSYVIFSRIAFTLSSRILNSFVKPSFDFESLNSLLKVYLILFSSIKVFDSRDMIKKSIKYGHQIIQIFTKSFLPVFDRLFVSHGDNIQIIFKQFQQCTRLLQHICRHAKVHKDMSIMASVPNLKKSLETFIYRVKLMLEKNGYSDAFWLGTLKNRDIYGEEALSQPQISQ